MTSLDEKPDTREKTFPRTAVSAAQLQLVIDRRLGRETPDWVRRIAEDRPEEESAPSSEAG